MIAYLASRGVKLVAGICGADEKDSNAWAAGTAGLLSPIDPVGGILGVGHAAAGLKAAEGHKGAAIVDKSMSLVMLCGTGLPDPSSAADVADVASMAADTSSVAKGAA